MRLRLACFPFASLAVLVAACSGASASDVPSTPDASAVPPALDAGAPSPDGGTSTPIPDASAPPTSSPSAGCMLAASRYPAGTTEGSIVFGGRKRTFRVHVPASYAAGKPAPAVLLFHGGAGSGAQLQGESAEMDPIAEREGFLTIYPDGTGLVQTWNGGLCCGKAVEDDVDDVGFVGKLLDQLEKELCVDTKRVFATGMSNGAILTHRLACELSSRFAAVAPVAGTIGVGTCQPDQSVAVMQIHGTMDGHVPFAGGVGCGPAGVAFVSVPDTLAGWRQRNGCAATSKPTFQQGNGSCVAYDGCQAPVVLCSVEGGGHSWPGGVPKVGVVDCPADGPQSTTFSASEVAWSFFAANPKR